MKVTTTSNKVFTHRACALGPRRRFGEVVTGTHPTLSDVVNPRTLAEIELNSIKTLKETECEE